MLQFALEHEVEGFKYARLQAMRQRYGTMPLYSVVTQRVLRQQILKYAIAEAKQTPPSITPPLRVV